MKAYQTGGNESIKRGETFDYISREIKERKRRRHDKNVLKGEWGSPHYFEERKKKVVGFARKKTRRSSLRIKSSHSQKKGF